MEKILKRKDVAEEETWVLDDLFKNFGDWENSFNQLPKEEELDKIINDKFKGKLKNNPEVLFECLKFKDNLSRKLENLYVYANLRSSEDVANKEANEFSGKIEVKMTGLFTLFAFLDPEILTIPNIES